MRTELDPFPQRASGLVDVLDRVLDKGLVIAGDIRVSLAEVELLTIRIRLLVCSIDKAQEIGLDWWKHDRYFSSNGRLGNGEPQAALGVEERADVPSSTAEPPIARPAKRTGNVKPRKRPEQ